MVIVVLLLLHAHFVLRNKKFSQFYHISFPTFIEAETDIDYHLRLLAVNEWMQHIHDYLDFLDSYHTVAKDAPRFLQQGHLYGPLGTQWFLQ